MTETTWTNPNHLAVREQFESPEFHSPGVIANVAGPGGRYAILRDGEALAIHRVDPTRVLRSVGEFLAEFPDGTTDYGAWSMDRWPYFIVVDTEALSAGGRGLDDGVLCYHLPEALWEAERLAGGDQAGETCVSCGARKSKVVRLDEHGLCVDHVGRPPASYHIYDDGSVMLTSDKGECVHVDRDLAEQIAQAVRP